MGYISRGSAISCSHIEAALTATEISDRVLGVSQVETVSSTTVQIFTGNSITARRYGEPVDDGTPDRGSPRSREPRFHPCRSARLDGGQSQKNSGRTLHVADCWSRELPKPSGGKDAVQGLVAPRRVVNGIRGRPARHQGGLHRIDARWGGRRRGGRGCNRRIEHSSKD